MRLTMVGLRRRDIRRRIFNESPTTSLQPTVRFIPAKYHNLLSNCRLLRPSLTDLSDSERMELAGFLYPLVFVKQTQVWKWLEIVDKLNEPRTDKTWSVMSFLELELWNKTTFFSCFSSFEFSSRLDHLLIFVINRLC